MTRTDAGNYLTAFHNIGLEYGKLDMAKWCIWERCMKMLGIKAKQDSEAHAACLQWIAKVFATKQAHIVKH